MNSKPSADPKRPAAPGVRMSWLEVLGRLAITLLLVGGYYGFREPLAEFLGSLYARATGTALDHSNRLPYIVSVVVMLAGLVLGGYRSLMGGLTEFLEFILLACGLTIALLQIASRRRDLNP